MTADLKAAPGRGCILCWPVDVIYWSLNCAKSPGCEYRGNLNRDTPVSQGAETISALTLFHLSSL